MEVLNPPSSSRFRWSLDFSSRAPGHLRGGPDLPSPVGYSGSVAQLLHQEASRSSDPALRAKRSWDVAMGPIKQVPMNLFISYMSGNAISIFPIMMVIMMAIRPIQTLMSVGATFKTLDSITDGQSSNLGQKAVFVLGNLVNVAMAFYKCHSMGLLPTHASDWLAFADPIERAEWAYVAL